jgi:hypothetical protein
MNKFKEKPEIQKQQDKPRKTSPVLRSLFAVMDGSFLSNDSSLKHLPFGLFLCLVAGFYIANTYNAERTVRSTDRIGAELKELRSEYISLKSELMYTSNQSQVAERAMPLGLKEANEPPHKLYITQIDSTTLNN